MKKLIVSTLILVAVIFWGNVLVADDTAAKVQTGIGILGGILNKASKSKENQQQAEQENKGQTQATSEQSSNNANIQTQEPSFSKDDISNLSSKIKTNLSSGDMMEIMNSPFHLIAIQAPDIKFGQLFCLFGEGQLS
ncbi:MAG: hypothetical protein PHW73_06740, partial [Atribacterota bacterium]|nr:hypothetical protein [Atribacterota bacterium]